MQTHHWAMTAGQYLLKRRNQTKHAYQNHLVPDLPAIDTKEDTKEDLSLLFSQYHETLIEVLLFQLGSELEIGHTVIHIYEQTKNQWQYQLIEKLLYNWHDLPAMTDQTILIEQLENLHYISELKNQLFTDNQITKETRLYLLSQLTLARQLYQFFNQLNRLTENRHADSGNPSDKTLSVFFRYLSQLPFVITQDQLNSVACTQSSSAPIISYMDNDTHQVTLWLHRSWQAEQSIINNIHRLNDTPLPLLDLSNINQSTLKAEQLTAIDIANKSAFSIITGGPGTGKTYTVAQLVIAIYHANQQRKQQKKQPLNLILTAPTGKAAQRMQESLQSALDREGVSMTLQEAKTIHRLLGIGRRGMPKYGIDMPLAEDVIIVDEASMLGVELASYLLNSIKTGARLILLGDAHQLSAVEAGSVLSDLCQIPALKDVHATLTQSNRFSENSAVGQLATLINQPDQTTNIMQALKSLFHQHSQYLSLQTISSHKNHHQAEPIYEQLTDCYEDYFSDSLAFQSIDKPSLTKLMDSFNQFRILTSGHHGDYGDNTINTALTQYHREYLKLPLSELEWYHGRPIMVRKNNYNLGLFNGDIGICIDTGDGLAVYFDGKESVMAVNTLINLEVSTAYAITVHKSQGSEFTHVAVMIAHAYTNALLSRELLYTAVTRAKQKVSIYGTLATMQQAITEPTIRHTGLNLVK